TATLLPMLVAPDDLGLGNARIMFGALTINRLVGAHGILRAGLVIETLTHLTLATTTSAALALGVLFVFGMHEAAWGTTVATVRQRMVPEQLLGRVGSVYTIGVFGGLVVGAALGGVIADVFGLTAPFWTAFGGSALLVVVLSRELGQVAAVGRRGVAPTGRAAATR
ncbi:MAG: MFS transporter, partial [Acidimicrobiia bacterium]|nr:MFS transporter [Acidimicrobiia bacterium]